MKKILFIFLCLLTVFAPFKAEAKSYNFSGYYCDAKQPLDDKTFYLTCHIVVSTDFNVNHIKGNLILKNVKLEDIRTANDWKNNNGLETTVDFTAASNHMGSFSVADLVFTGNLADTECEASFEPLVVEEVVTTPTPSNPVCAIVDNEYYGKDGSKITEEKYYEDCCNYVCEVVDNKYYFNKNGKSVSYNEFLNDCSSEEYVPSTPDTGINYGYIILPIGIVSIIAIVKITKKNNKIYKI